MLLIIRQPLGAAALIGLLGTGLFSAEMMACAQWHVQASHQRARTSTQHNGECGHPSDRPKRSDNAGQSADTSAASAKLGQVASALEAFRAAVFQLRDTFPAADYSLDPPCFADAMASDAASLVAGNSRFCDDLTSQSRQIAADPLVLYGLGAEHG